MYKKIKRGVTDLFRPISTDEDSSRKEFIFNVCIVTISTLVSLHIFAILTAIFFGEKDYTGVPVYIMLLILTFYISLFLLSKYNSVKLAINIFIASLSIIVLITQAKWGFDFPSALLMWTLLIATTSILVSTRTAIIMSVLITTISFISISSESVYTIEAKQSWKNSSFTHSNAVEYGFIFLAISTISWLSNKEIYSALTRAKKSESDLRQERDNLDATVKQKTKELQDSQIEKINHMYRLVEFGRLSSGLFHDLSSPLTAMAMEVSENHTNSNNSGNIPGTEQRINHLIQSTKKIITLVEKAKRQIQISDTKDIFSINNEISDVIEMLKSKSYKSKVSIIFKSDKSINYSGSSVIFSHIVNNLISNAIDSYKDIQDARERKVFVWLNKDSKNIKIIVKDFGSGIDTEIQTKIFEPFFTTKESSGCGIGLSATKHNLEKYFSGTISLKSTLQNGTLFEVLIPKTRTINDDNHSNNFNQNIEQSSVEIDNDKAKV